MNSGDMYLIRDLSSFNSISCSLYVSKANEPSDTVPATLPKNAAFDTGFLSGSNVL